MSTDPLDGCSQQDPALSEESQNIDSISEVGIERDSESAPALAVEDIGCQQEASSDTATGAVDDSSRPSDHDSIAEEPQEPSVTVRLEQMERRLLESFEKKLAYDQFKEQQIQNLHKELQEHKQGLADALMMPLVKQLVRYLDQIPRHVEALKKKPVEQLGPERLFKELGSVREDLEMILENVGVTVFQNPDPKFDPRCQQACETVQTGNRQHHDIVERLLPGYKMNGRLIEKERVKVFVETQKADAS